MLKGYGAEYSAIPGAVFVVERGLSAKNGVTETVEDDWEPKSTKKSSSSLSSSSS